MTNLLLHIDQAWMWFCIASGISLLLTLFMGRLNKQLMSRDGSLRNFAMVDLEFPSNPLDIPNLINGVYKLPEEQRDKVLKSLKNLLYLDFLFMPAVYGAIFIICQQVAVKMGDSPIGQGFFIVLAWAQVIAWLCDIIENSYLLRCIHPDLKPSKQSAHMSYVVIVWLKWGLALIGGISALMMVIYFLLKGSFESGSLPWAGVYVAEIVLFLVAGRWFKVKKNVVPAA